VTSRILDAVCDEAETAGVSLSERDVSVLDSAYVELSREERRYFKKRLIPRMLVLSLLVVAVVAHKGQGWVKRQCEIELPTRRGGREALVHTIVRMVARSRFEWNYGGIGPIGIIFGLAAIVSAFTMPTWLWLPLAALASVLVFQSVVVNAHGRQRVRESDEFGKALAHVRSLGMRELKIR
jgi:hypothetical protein